LFAFAQGEGVLPANVVDPLVVVVALSMAATPLLFIVAEIIAGKLVSPIANRLEEAIESNKPHAIIAGYGRVGQTVGRLLDANGYRTSVLEHDADQVEALRGFGRKVNYGDASRIDLLRAAGAEDAQVIVVAIDDQSKTLEIVDTVRRHFPHLKVLARAFDRRHAYELIAKNVDGFERETFDSSVRLGMKTLNALGVSNYHAERAGEVFRRYDEKILHEMSKHWGADMATFQKMVRDNTAMFEELMRTDIEAMRNANANDPDYPINEPDRAAEGG
jgi:voltage-gated potassium channel Kch